MRAAHVADKRPADASGSTLHAGTMVCSMLRAECSFQRRRSGLARQRVRRLANKRVPVLGALSRSCLAVPHQAAVLTCMHAAHMAGVGPAGPLGSAQHGATVVCFLFRLQDLCFRRHTYASTNIFLDSLAHQYQATRSLLIVHRTQRRTDPTWRYDSSLRN
jgi:hypothetical protein